MRERGQKMVLVAEVVGSPSVGGFLPADPSGVRWEGYSHGDMWSMIMRARPDQLFARVDRWRAVAARLVEGNKGLQRELDALLRTWQGPAAAAAATSQQRLLDWAQEAATRADAVGARLGDYGNALVDARARMPQPQHRTAEMRFRDGEEVTVRDGAAGAHMLLQMLSDRLPSARETREAREEAMRVMRELEAEATRAEQAMPQFAAAPKTTNEAVPPPVWPGTDPDRPWTRPGGPTPGTFPPPLPEHASPTTTSAQAAGEYPGRGPNAFPGATPNGPGGQGALSGPGGGMLTGAGPYGGSGQHQAGAHNQNGPRAQGGMAGQGPVPGAKPQPAVPPSTRAGSAGGMNGFVPGGAGARADGDEDREKPLAAYLEADELFKDERPVSRAVWGA